MTTKTRNWLLALCIVVLPFLTFSGFIAFDFFAPPTLQPLPNPNGYDDFVKAMEMVSSNTFNFDKMNERELQTLVDDNSNSLQLVRSGLQMQCRVALDYSP